MVVGWGFWNLVNALVCVVGSCVAGLLQDVPSSWLEWLLPRNADSGTVASQIDCEEMKMGWTSSLGEMSSNVVYYLKDELPDIPSLVRDCMYSQCYAYSMLDLLPYLTQRKRLQPGSLLFLTIYQSQLDAICVFDINWPFAGSSLRSFSTKYK